MVETDIGDDGEDRSEHVGAVEPSAESHFHHGEIHLLPHEIIERECGHGLEE